MLIENVYIIVIYDVITVDYCKCILLYSPLNSYLYVYWILDFIINIIIIIKVHKLITGVEFLNSNDAFVVALNKLDRRYGDDMYATEALRNKLLKLSKPMTTTHY